MDRIIYLVQPFSRGPDGSLQWDAPAWSQDHGFAASLSRALARRKVGVVTYRTTITESGELGTEADMIASYGTVPTALLAQPSSAAPQPARAPLQAVGGTGLKRRA
ncbi:MAG TPA: hypothetical protein VIL09_09745 [Microvirga sp.]|jgi:hypothetical protein